MQEEFEDLEFDAREQKLIVRTEPIELLELGLGPFAIQLNIKRLADRPDSDSFRCIALKPKPAANDSSVTHPHVKNESLCAGEATLPISQALEQGRLCDAFILVRAVLRTYNEQSPYVSLDDWEGVTCSDCDCSVQRDRLSFCEHCDRDVCDECSGSCDLCDQTCCRSCLEHDPKSGKHCCPNCRYTCADCDRVVDSNSFDAESDLCPHCLAAANAEADETETSLTTPENTDEPQLESQPQSPGQPDRGDDVAADEGADTVSGPDPEGARASAA